MSSAFRVLRGTRQRNLAFNLVVGSSTIVAYNSWLYERRRPLLADSGESGQEWGSRSVLPSWASSARKKPSSVESSDKPAGRSSGTASSQTSSTVSSAEGGSYEDGLQAWQIATSRISALASSLIDFNIAGLKERILPTWIQMLPRWLDKLQNELSMAPWSLSWEIWEDAHNPEANPEIIWDAQVRISKELCPEEQRFIQQRRFHTTRALAKYLDVPESDIHPADVPVIAMCGSGGGLRALVAGASSYLCAAEDGLFDCTTYTAGVSGSCWLQALYYTSVGQQNYGNIIQHLKNRLGTHIAEPASLLKLLIQAPTNKYLLSGYVEKLRGVPDSDFGLVDVYGLALAARLLVPRGELSVNDTDLKVSNQRAIIDFGHAPLPIYTAVRHEIPGLVEDVGEQVKSVGFTKKHFDWFQWFEWTPYEFFSEDLEAGIPSWAVGRTWEAGKTVWRENGFALPELRIPLYLGIWGSAFCATLSHYYKEIRPIVKAAGMSGLDTLVSGKDEDLVKVHPIDPAVIPNYVLGLRGQLSERCPESIHETSHLELMDAGMANNLPIYPLLRPGRDVDIVIAFDASADVRGDNWINAVDGYVAQRGIKGWPMGAGWPPQTNTEDQTIEELGNAEKGSPKLENTTEKNQKKSQGPLGHCTVWVGNTQKKREFMDEHPPDRVQSEDDHDLLRSADAGIAVVYFPLLANEKVPGIDPLTSPFMSTWNFVYEPQQIDDVVALARANFEEGKEQTRRTIRAVWERKRMMRLEQEARTRSLARASRVRKGGAALRRNGDVGHGDQFS